MGAHLPNGGTKGSPGGPGCVAALREAVGRAQARCQELWADRDGLRIQLHALWSAWAAEAEKRADQALG